MTKPIEQLQAKVAELEEALLKTKMDLLTSYGESEELLGRIAELEADVERLSAAHVKACQANADSQAELAKAEQRVAEACALAIYSECNSYSEVSQAIIRSGEWRKFVKEV